MLGAFLFVRQQLGFERLVLLWRRAPRPRAGERPNGHRAFAHSHQDLRTRTGDRKLAEVEEATSRGEYHEAIKISKEVLAAYPGHAEAGELLQESERLLAESLRAPAPRPRPAPRPEPEVVKRTIPPEAVEAYGRVKAALAGGDIGGAIRILGAVVGEYPTYGAARGKLVDAYLLRGLDFYSRGELTAALKALRRALIYDPGNAKVKRYIKRVEGELK